ncbi:MAG: hypothetical protein ABSD21_08840 [Rhizomicrobium sp.]|jgi:hypothetical protein
MGRTTDDDETIRKRSGWLIPLGVFLVTFALSALFLLIYLAPSAPSLFEEQLSPTSRSDIVALKVSGHRFFIPANYLEYESARQGGDRREIALFAMLPDLTGWSNWEAQTFADNGVKSPIVEMRIRQETLNLSEADRFERIYMGYVLNPRGAEGPYGLRQYAFRQDSGYHNEDLFVGKTDTGLLVMRCVRLGPDVLSPNCFRDMRIARGVSLFYRFKRAHLSKWREIDDGVDKLIASFEKAPK